MTVEDTWSLTGLVNGEIVTTGCDAKSTVTAISMPPLMTHLIQVWNYEWTDLVVEVIYITSSVVFPLILLTEGSSPTQTSSTGNLTLVPFWYTYSPDPFSPCTGPSQTPGQSSSPTSSILPPPPPPGSHGSVHATQGPPSPTPKPVRGRFHIWILGTSKWVIKMTFRRR